jgi:hypothetical protein
MEHANAIPGPEDTEPFSVLTAKKVLSGGFRLTTNLAKRVESFLLTSDSLPRRENDSNIRIVSVRREPRRYIHALRNKLMTFKSINGQEMPYVEERFGKLASQYRELKQGCEAKVVAWQWASNEWYDPRPLWFQRQGITGQALKMPPKKQDYKYEYGFDRRGVIMSSSSTFDSGAIENGYGLRSLCSGQ